MLLLQCLSPHLLVQIRCLWGDAEVGPVEAGFLCAGVAGSKTHLEYLVDAAAARHFKACVAPDSPLAQCAACIASVGTKVPIIAGVAELGTILREDKAIAEAAAATQTSIETVIHVGHRPRTARLLRRALL